MQYDFLNGCPNPEYYLEEMVAEKIRLNRISGENLN